MASSLTAFFPPHRLTLHGLMILVMALVLVAPLAAQGKKKREAGPTLVRTDRVQMKPRATSQTFVGSLEPIRRAVIGSAVEERVKEVLVREGEFVTSQGEQPTLLVELEHESIDIELEATQIELDLREAAIKELTATIPTQIDAAEAEVARLEAQLEYAKQVYDRMQGLGSSMSDKEVEESISLYNAATQSYNAAKADLKRLNATREVRLLIANRNIARQKAELKRVRDQQTKHKVVTPFDGYVSRKMVERGNWVTKGTPLVEIIQLDPIELRIQVPQEYASTLQDSFDAANKSSPFLARVMIDSVETPIQGTVARIIPDADPVTRAVPVIIRIANPPRQNRGIRSHLLKPGMLAKAQLDIGQGTPVLMVPKDALVLNQGAASIYLVDDQNKVRQISIKTGKPNGNWIEITGDVQEDDVVVVQGNERLRNGETVKILK